MLHSYVRQEVLGSNSPNLKKKNLLKVFLFFLTFRSSPAYKQHDRTQLYNSYELKCFHVKKTGGKWKTANFLGPWLAIRERKPVNEARPTRKPVHSSWTHWQWYWRLPKPRRDKLIKTGPIWSKESHPRAHSFGSYSLHKNIHSRAKATVEWE